MATNFSRKMLVFAGAIGLFATSQLRDAAACGCFTPPAG